MRRLFQKTEVYTSVLILVSVSYAVTSISLTCDIMRGRASERRAEKRIEDLQGRLQDFGYEVSVRDETIKQLSIVNEELRKRLPGLD